MKVVNKNKEKKFKNKKKPIIKPKKEQVLVVAQEFKFARLLSGNDKKTRDRVLKALKKWLLNCFEKGHEFKEDDFLRVWKGLFYAVWMSDKPLIQEDLCEAIAGILDLFPKEQIRHAMLMLHAGLKILATEWFGIDHHRMDKFLMLVRRYLRGGLRCLLRCEWSIESCKLFADTLAGNDGILALKTPSYVRNATSMVMHVIECFVEELSKVSQGEVPPESVAQLVRPFCAYVGGGAAAAARAACGALLEALLRTSGAGLRYHAAARAWHQMGCPKGGPDALELVEESDEEMQNGEDEDFDRGEGALDPRAGRVDVVLPPLPVPGRLVAAALRDTLATATASSKAHRHVKMWMRMFEQLARDKFPLRMSSKGIDVRRPNFNPQEAATALQSLEKQLTIESDELALRGLKRKHRKRLLAKSRAGMSIIEEVEKLRAKKHKKSNVTDNNSTNGGWKIEDTDQQTNTKNETMSNKENVVKKNRNKKRKLEGESETEVKKQKVVTEVKTNGEVKAKKEKVEKTDAVLGVKKISNKKLDSEVKVKSVTKEANVASKAKHVNGFTEPLVNKVKGKKGSDLKNVDSKNIEKPPKGPSLLVSKMKNLQKNPKNTQVKRENFENDFSTPKKVKFVLKNNGMQGTMDYYKSVKKSPNIPFDSSKRPTKTNLKPSTPSPINPFYKKKLRLNL